MRRGRESYRPLCRFGSEGREQSCGRGSSESHAPARLDCGLWVPTRWRARRPPGAKSETNVPPGAARVVGHGWRRPFGRHGNGPFGRSPGRACEAAAGSGERARDARRGVAAVTRTLVRPDPAPTHRAPRPIRDTAAGCRVGWTQCGTPLVRTLRSRARVR
jgi:hypothetical protein